MLSENYLPVLSTICVISTQFVFLLHFEMRRNPEKSKHNISLLNANSHNNSVHTDWYEFFFLERSTLITFIITYYNRHFGLKSKKKICKGDVIYDQPLNSVTLFLSFSYLFFHSSAVSSSLSWATFLMVLALCPNSSVDLVSSLLVSAGEQQMTIVVLAFPPSDSFKDCMSYETA